MSTFKPVILKGKNDVKQDGTTNVKIRITAKGKHVYIPTNIFILPNELDENSGMCKSGKNKAFNNLRITSLLMDYRKAEIALGNDIEYMSAATIKQHLLKEKKQIQEIDFLSFIDMYAKSTKVAGTREQYFSLKNSLSSFSGNILPVTAINLNYLTRYEKYLR